MDDGQWMDAMDAESESSGPQKSVEKMGCLIRSKGLLDAASRTPHFIVAQASRNSHRIARPAVNYSESQVFASTTCRKSWGKAGEKLPLLQQDCYSQKDLLKAESCTTSERL